MPCSAATTADLVAGSSSALALAAVHGVDLLVWASDTALKRRTTPLGRMVLIDLNSVGLFGYDK